MTSPGQTALKVETTYHAGTSLVAMVESDEATSTIYAYFSDYDASGKIKTAMYGYEPGDGDYATRTDYHYRPATGRLGEIRTIQGNLINDPDNPETILQNKVYNYTKAGDVSRISTIVNRNMQVYEYEYDDLHRLTAERRIGSVPSNVIERYDNEFEGPQAHAVSSTVHQLTYGTMPYEVSYDYDENGNLTSKEEVNQWAQPGITVTLNKTDVTYTVENLPKSIVRFTDDDGDGSGTEVYTDFLYDPAGRRIRKHTQPPAWEEYKYYLNLARESQNLK